MTWILRGCPHCGGDTFLSKDIGNIWIENCLQCGYDAVKNKVDGELRVGQTYQKAICPATSPVQIGSL